MSCQTTSRRRHRRRPRPPVRPSRMRTCPQRIPISRLPTGDWARSRNRSDSGTPTGRRPEQADLLLWVSGMISVLVLAPDQVDSLRQNPLTRSFRAIGRCRHRLQIERTRCGMLRPAKNQSGLHFTKEPALNQGSYTSVLYMHQQTSVAIAPLRSGYVSSSGVQCRSDRASVRDLSPGQWLQLRTSAARMSAVGGRDLGVNRSHTRGSEYSKGNGAQLISFNRGARPFGMRAIITGRPGQRAAVEGNKVLAQERSEAPGYPARTLSDCLTVRHMKYTYKSPL